MNSARFKVAEHLLEVRLPDTLITTDIIPSFSPFVCEEEGDVLFTMTVTEGVAPDFSAWEEVGQFDCGGANHGVYRKADGSYAFEISLPDCDGGALSCCMIAYAFAAAEQDTLLVHASVIRHEGKGYLFTAPSGTGKSTHTWLWHKYIPGCDLMNDDNPVVRIAAGETRIYGSPWSGKTPCYRNIWAPVGAITRIEQKPENTIRRMAPVEAFATLLPAVSSMKWDRRVYNGICQTISQLLAITPVFWLGCRPDEEAVRVCFAGVKAS